MLPFGVSTIDADDWLDGNQYICNNLSYILSFARHRPVSLLGGLILLEPLANAPIFGFMHLPTFEGGYSELILETLSEEIKDLGLRILFEGVRN